MITSEENPVKVLEEKPFIETYFTHNIQLISPEIFSRDVSSIAIPL